MPLIKVEKEEWLKSGIDRFSSFGITGINVESMANELQCNKSSFYWHFTSKENFVHQFILYWFTHSIQPITDEVTKQKLPSNRFESFLRMSFEDKSRKDFMFHLRKLAPGDSELQSLVDELTQKRLDFTSMLIQELGYSPTAARDKAEIVLSFYIGWYELHKYPSENDSSAVDHAINLIKDFINF